MTGSGIASVGSLDSPPDEPNNSGRQTFHGGEVDVEFISIPEWGRRMGISKDSAYKAARLGQIPGCFAIGRLYRVNWPAFVERSGLAGRDQSVEAYEQRSANLAPWLSSVAKQRVS